MRDIRIPLISSISQFLRSNQLLSFLFNIYKKSNAFPRLWFLLLHASSSSTSTIPRVAFVMENRADFVEWLGPDTSVIVLKLVDDPIDLKRVSAVSRSWRRFVITNSLCKLLCLRICPEASHFARVIEGDYLAMVFEVACSTSIERQTEERKHRAYSYLSCCLVMPMVRVRIADAISASSTDNYPHESIANTLIEGEQGENLQNSYWSSTGQSDPGVPETLTYKLGSNFCIINEIKVQPFEAFYQPDSPIYSAKTVRFRIGHLVSPGETEKAIANGTDIPFLGMYVSPEFPMVQQNTLQSFKLPRPVICFGGLVQIDLSSRVQVQATDGLYCICISHVQIIGRALFPDLE